ncbi:P-loop NTPase fold protein [Halobacteriovorax sp. ZH1_bin.1]|uniref:P-loop NTPase fold protein n=1 Tax=Halobacteriovorax sp. ZH1_bin.1 TaxID=3157723 RepID=UPI0037172BCC
MKNREIIKSTIINHFKKNKPGAIGIVGPWGCGKTYLWDEVKRSLDGTLYVSLFGCSSVEDLKKRIFSSYLMNEKERFKGKELGEIAKDAGALVKENGWKALGEIAKVAMKGADSFFGTNIISINTDVLNILSENNIICFDDIERISGNLTISEVLGVMDFLVREKSTRILLVLNEEHLKDKKHEDFKSYLEKITNHLIKIEADVDSLFDLFIEESTQNSFLKENKTFILEPYKKSNFQNLRTLLKTLSIVEEILENDISLSENHLKTISFYIIEWSKGCLKDVDYYNFSGGSLLVNWGDEKEEDERKVLLEKYFFEISDYSFSTGLLEFVIKSYCDFKELKSEINPPEKKESVQQKLISKLCNTGWYFLKTTEAEKIKDELKEVFESQAQDFDAGQLFTCITYYEYLHFLLEVKIDPNEKDQIINIFKKKGELGDSSINSFLTMHFTDFSAYWESYYKVYKLELNKALANVQYEEAKNIFKSPSLQEFVNFIYQKPINLKSIIEDGLDDFLAVREVDSKFFHQSCDFLIDELNKYNEDFISNIEELNSILKNKVVEISNQEEDKLEKRRLKKLLSKIR